MRSPVDMDIMQVDITNKCFLRCSNCTRLVAHQDEPYEMDLDAFRRACESLVGWLKPGKVVGLIGGEPSMHSQFEDICLIARDVFNRPPLKHARQPIADFNAFANERLYDRSNGLGLWTSLGPSFYKHYEVIMETFSHWNVNDHHHPGRHQALLIDRAEYNRIYGQTDEEWIRNRDKCWVQNTWSGTITPHGAYFCEVAGAIDNLFYAGKHAWPITRNSGPMQSFPWWDRKPPFADQLSLCNHCALAQPGPSSIANDDTDVLCAVSLDRLKAVNSPAVRREKFELLEGA